MSELKPCPLCRKLASIRHSNDQDGCYWAHIECNGCGLRTRGKWASNRGDACPIFYAEVRDEWNTRTPAPEQPATGQYLAGKNCSEVPRGNGYCINCANGEFEKCLYVTGRAEQPAAERYVSVLDVMEVLSGTRALPSPGDDVLGVCRRFIKEYNCLRDKIPETQAQADPVADITGQLWSLFEFGKNDYRGCARETIEELLKLYTQPQRSAEQEWQLIETAPKDGSEVLLKVKFRAGVPGKYLVGHYMPGAHCIEDHPPIEQGWYFWNGNIFDHAAEPTHRKPLEQPQRAAVPDGFKLVPIKPPEEILKAMMRAIEDRELYDQQLRHAAINCWDAMLAAAPDREG